MLIRPPFVASTASLSTHGPTPPIGLAYIAATLRAGGHRVQVIDAQGEAIDQHVEFASPVGPVRRIGLAPDEIVERIPPGVAVIGISLMFFHEWPLVREIAELARRRCPAATIIAGGETATAFWRWMFEQTSAIDHVVLGEGEATALALVDRVASGEPVEGIPGLATAHPDAPATGTGLPVRLRDLEQIPRPAWDLFDLDAYWRNPYFGVHRGRSMPMLATRGCPYKCSFCSSPQMWTTRYVVRDPDDLADEIESYVGSFAIENVNFVDLTAMTKRQWTLDFCDALEARDLDITWQLPLGTRSETLDEHLLRRVYDTGCRNIVLAPESGSQRMVEIFDKRVDLNHVLDTIAAARRSGLKTHVNLIVGHPDETWHDLRQTLRFLVRAAARGCDDAAAVMFCPYPGSADFDRLLADGTIEIDDALCFLGLGRSSSLAKSYNRRISSRQLRLIQIAMMAVFYASTVVLHPSRVLSFVKSQITGRETTYLDQMARSFRQARRSGGGRAPHAGPVGASRSRSEPPAHAA